MSFSESEQWVLVQLDKQLFGLPGKAVREMVSLPNVTTLPQAPKHIRGIINLRGQIIPVLDLRLLLGFPSRQQDKFEICSMMAQREEDHKNWLKELETCVREEREFTLATDPHQCKFGKWYYSYHTDNQFFRAYLNRFESPHTKIHKIAIQVGKLLATGNRAAAIKLVEDCRASTLMIMTQLFSRFSDEYSSTHTEIGVIMRISCGEMAVCVDSAVSIESIQQCASEEMPIPEKFRGDLSLLVGRRKGKNEIVILLDTSHLSN